MTTATPPAAPRATGKKSVPQPPLSLTKAAKAVDVSTSTLRRAIRDGRLKAVKTEEGHYRIKIDELMQYKSNELDTLSTQGVAEASAQGATSSVAEDVDIPAAGVSTLALIKEAYDGRIAGLEAHLKDKDATIRRLEDDVSDWKSRADAGQKLLTDERENISNMQAELDAGQGGKSWAKNIAIAAAFMVALAAFYYRDNLAVQWTNLTASNDALPVVAESENSQS